MKHSIRLLIFGALALLASACTPVDESTLPVHTKGNADAKVVVQEFADFQCPYCAVHSATTVRNLLDEFGDAIRFEYRHYPLMRIHRQAELAAIASEAAGRQGKFWQMHDVIYLNQEAWAENNGAKELFIEYARQLNLDIEQFQQDLGNNEIRATIARDMRLGNEVQVTGTPTFIVNGKRFDADKDYYNELVAFIRSEVNAVAGSTPTETPVTE